MNNSALLNPTPGSVRRVEERNLCQDLRVVYNAIENNGRYFHVWRTGKYMFPCDQEERARSDYIHMLIYRHVLHILPSPAQCNLGSIEAALLVPTIDHSQVYRVLDLGTGSGIWTIDIARRYPKAQVVGVDLVETQPGVPLQNVVWRVPGSRQGSLDFDDDHWNLGSETFDYIRLGHLCGSVSDWPLLLSKCLTHLTPSRGHVEIMDFDWRFRRANGRLPPNSPLSLYWDNLHQASRAHGRPLRVRQDMDDLLEGVGYDSIVHQRHRIPLTLWSYDETQFYTGRGMAAYLAETLEMLGIGLLPAYLGISAAQVRRQAQECVEFAMDPRNEIFVTLHVWTARRPGPRNARLPQYDPTTFAPDRDQAPSMFQTAAKVANYFCN